MDADAGMDADAADAREAAAEAREADDAELAEPHPARAAVHAKTAQIFLFMKAGYRAALRTARPVRTSVKNCYLLKTTLPRTPPSRTEPNPAMPYHACRTRPRLALPRRT
jgi:hypothetical protein